MLTEAQRQIMRDGQALVVHCATCGEDHFLGQLPMEPREISKACRFKCPTDISHKIMMGPASRSALDRGSEQP
jgi:hypothetical protein